MIRAVIFDLDGTLFDREQALLKFVSDQYERLPELHWIPKPAYIARFTSLDSHGSVWKDTVYQTLVAEYGIKGLTWEKLLEDYETKFPGAAIRPADLVPTLESLSASGYPLGIISNGRTAFQRSVIAALRIEQYFAAILISEEEGVRKPDAEIFHRATSRLGVEPGECAYVGDHPMADIAGARDAGLRAVWLRNTRWPAPFACDGVIEKLSELPALLGTLA